MSAVGTGFRPWLAAVAGCVLVATAGPAAAYPRPGGTEWVSVRPSGLAGAASGVGAISGHGRFVVFQSTAALVPEDSNGLEDVFLRDRVLGTLDRASVATGGGQGTGSSIGAAVSGDGRFVVFHSTAPDLAPGNTNGTDLDVFLHDREAGTTEMVSVTPAGTSGNSISYFGAMSADGRFVAFQSFASDLVPGDTNGSVDVFVRDREAGTTQRVSVGPGGLQADDGSATAGISADGRLVSFQSLAANLVTGDGNAAWDVFVHDRETATTERVSVSSAGQEGDERSLAPRITPDGRHVAFSSFASNLVPADRNETDDAFVHDRTTGITERVSVASSGAEGNLGSSVPAISADGRHVAFQSFASNLVPGDVNGETDIFVHDRQTGVTERVSVGAEGQEGAGRSQRPTISADGGLVAFDSYAANLVQADGDQQVDVFVRDRGPSLGVGGLTAGRSGDRVDVSGWATFSGVEVAWAADPGADGEDALGAEILNAGVTYRPEVEDLLLRLRLSSIPVAGPVGTPGVLYRWTLSHGGRAFEVRALGAGAAGAGQPSFALYECDVVCVEAAPLGGGVGVAGPEVWVSVPVAGLGADEGSVVGGLQAAAGLGEAVPGAAVILDEVEVPDALLPPARVEVGLGPALDPEEEIEYQEAVTLEGRFGADLDASWLPPGPARVWARACLGAMCRSTSVQIQG